MRHLAITSLIAGLAFAMPAFAQDDPMQNDPQQPSASEPADDTFQPSADDDSMPGDEGAADDGLVDERDQNMEDADAAAAEAGAGEYVVKEGDTLSQIAEEQLGDAAKWEQIAQDNEIDDPTKLTVGKRLSLPEANAEDTFGEREQ